jgi:hypothetical protein
VQYVIVCLDLLQDVGDGTEGRSAAAAAAAAENVIIIIEIRPYKITYLILISVRPNFYGPPQCYCACAVATLYQISRNYAPDIGLSKNKKPPPPQFFGKRWMRIK